MSEVAHKTLGQMIVGYFKDFAVLKETRSEYWGIQIINFIDSTIYFAVLSIASVFLSEDLGLSDEYAGYAITLFTTATTILLFFSGMFTDWLGIKKSINFCMWSVIILRIGMVIIGLTPSIPYRGIIATILFFLMAPSMALIQTVFQSANKRYTTERSRGAGYSLWYLFMNLGAAGGGFLIDIVRKGLGLPNTHIFTVGIFIGILCVLANKFLIKRETQLTDSDETIESKNTGHVILEKEVIKKNPLQIIKEVFKESAFWRLVVLIFLMLGVRAVFVYLYMLMPKYWLRTIGSDAYIGTLQAINPIMIIIGIILFIPFVSKFNIFKMLVYGAMVSASSLFILTLPWQWFSSDMTSAFYIMSCLSLVMLSVGEVIWSPKLYEYTAAIAPPGQEGTYMGLTMIPWFLAKTVVSVLSGHMLTRWCPEGIGEKLATGQVSFWDSPSAMWLVLGIYALGGCLIALMLKGWLIRGTQITAKN